MHTCSAVLTSAKRFLVGVDARLLRPYATRKLERRFFSISPTLQDGFQAYNGTYPSRTHRCGELKVSDDGARTVLAGWIQGERKASKHLSFFPLKDSTGTAQLILRRTTTTTENNSLNLSNVPPESIVLIEGKVKARPPSARRQGPSGDVEVEIENFTLLNPASDLPFSPSDTSNLSNEELRNRFRYLDLRRDELGNNLRKRGRITQLLRNRLYDHGFIEVETPLLLNSSPEGAREYLVPTRLRRGKSAFTPLTTEKATSADSTQSQTPFYALAQSPQQPKQLLMCSGAIDKYFQFARCFRDEDGRRDRQPEFTQLDMEMAFVSWGSDEADSTDGWRIGGREVKVVIEDLIRYIWKESEGLDLPESFPVMTYQEAMSKYGSDKPDTRFGLEIQDATKFLPPDLANHLRGEIVECLVVHSSDPWALANLGDSGPMVPHEIDSIDINSANIACWLSQATRLKGFIGAREDYPMEQLNTALQLSAGDHVYVTRRKAVTGGSTPMGQLRLRLCEAAVAKGTIKLTDEPHFLWVTEFPLFTRDDKDKDFLAKGRWSSSHHPFTAPMWQDLAALESGDIDRVRGQHYDLVLNGLEIGGGSVRIHDGALQERVFRDILELAPEELDRFGHLLHALKCGAPPHGGIAIGFDRLLSILCRATSIRDVIAFPKTANGVDPAFKSPSTVSAELLKDYGLQPLRIPSPSTK